MRLENRIFQKLKSRQGESIAEVLAAMVVIALGIILLVSMEMAAQNLVRTSESNFTSNMTQKNGIEEGAAAGSSDVTTVDSQITLTRKDTTQNLNLTGSVQDASSTSSSSSKDTYDLGPFSQQISVQTITAPAENGLTMRYVPKVASGSSSSSGS